MVLNRSAITAAVCCVAIAAGLVGCASADPSSAAAAAADASPDRHDQLMSVLVGYQLPQSSIAATSNADADVQRTIVRMSQIAQSQGLVFDGSRANEGIVIVGKPGSDGPILLALAVYKTGGRVATQDSSFAKGPDFREGMKMRERFLSGL